MECCIELIRTYYWVLFFLPPVYFARSFNTWIFWVYSNIRRSSCKFLNLCVEWSGSYKIFILTLNIPDLCPVSFALNLTYGFYDLIQVLVAFVYLVSVSLLLNDWVWTFELPLTIPVVCPVYFSSIFSTCIFWIEQHIRRLYFSLLISLLSALACVFVRTGFRFPVFDPNPWLLGFGTWLSRVKYKKPVASILVPRSSCWMVLFLFFYWLYSKIFSLSL